MIWGSSGARQTAGRVPRKQTLATLRQCTGTRALGAAPRKDYLRVKSIPDFKSRGQKARLTNDLQYLPQQQRKGTLAQDKYGAASMRSRHPLAAVSMNLTTKLEYDPNCSQWPWLLCRVCGSCEYGPGDVDSLYAHQCRARCGSTSDHPPGRLN